MSVAQGGGSQWVCVGVGWKRETTRARRGSGARRGEAKLRYCGRGEGSITPQCYARFFDRVEHLASRGPLGWQRGLPIRAQRRLQCAVGVQCGLETLSAGHRFQYLGALPASRPPALHANYLRQRAGKLNCVYFPWSLTPCCEAV